MSIGPVVTALLAAAPTTAGSVRTAVGLILQDAGTTPLPAEPPIGGPVWTVVVPAILLVGSFIATYMLYRHFADDEG